MRTNRPRPGVVAVNHEGVPAVQRTPIDQLRRTVLACLLWERGFYEDGESVADRIRALVKECKPHEVADLAIDAREKQHLRHVPLLLCRELARYPSRFAVGETLARVIQRADEPGEFLSIYWSEEKAVDAKDRKPLAHQVKKGLALALRKFDEYQLAKYNGPASVRLRDVLFMTHAKPVDEAQAALWKRLASDTLQTPDTWEVALSGGASKKDTFERLIAEKKLGYMALLRNLRNMHAAEVPQSIVAAALLDGAAKSKALPFRYIAAARAVPQWEPLIDEAMQLALAGLDKLAGETVVLVDVSPSMRVPLSAKSDLSRMDAAFGVAILMRGICENARVFAFSTKTKEVPPRNGMALADAIRDAVPSDGTLLGEAVAAVAKATPSAVRLIVFTDEQSQDVVGAPHCKGYMVNVAHYQHGVGHGEWERIDGFSESVVDYIRALESIPS